MYERIFEEFDSTPVLMLGILIILTIGSLLWKTDGLAGKMVMVLISGEIVDGTVRYYRKPARKARKDRLAKETRKKDGEA